MPWLKIMKLIDTNVILRYILNDHEELSEKARLIIDGEDVMIVGQVVAEVIYVLKNVYNATREEIAAALLDFCEIDNVSLENEEILICAIEEYGSNNLDFVDLLLYSYQKHLGVEVVTFDKKLSAKLRKNIY